MIPPFNFFLSFRLTTRLLRLFNGTKLSYRFHLRYWFHPDLKVVAGVLASMTASRALRPEVESPIGKRILVISPHPDDEILGPGGTLLKAKLAGSKIHIVCLTNGEANAELGRVRIEESKKVSKKLGFEFYNLDLNIGDLKVDELQKRPLIDIVKKISPDIIFAPFILDDNADHRSAAVLLAEALRDIKDTKQIEIWAYQIYSAVPANVIVPIDSVVKQKERAINLYRSQVVVRDWAHYTLGLNAFNSRLTPRAVSAKFVENFFVLPGHEFIKLSDKYKKLVC